MKTTTPKHAKRRNGHQTLATVAPVTEPRVALYLRVSTDDQADRGTIDAQRDFLRGFVQLYSLPVADEYADDGITGTLSLSDRPEGRRLLQDAEAGRFGTVLVYRLTRLGRSLKALTEAHDALNRFGVTIRSATEPFDTSTPIGTFLFQLLGSLAELDRAQVLEQLSRGRDRVARTGRWTGGPVPFGYDLDTAGHLMPSTRMVASLEMTEADVARDVLHRIADGGTAHAETARLNIFKVPTARRYSGGKSVEVGAQWLPSRLSYMLHNSVYAGEHHLKSKYGTITREVPALVSRDVWERVQRQLQQNRSLPKGNATREYLLRGKIRCGVCGSTYVGSPGATIKSGRMYYYRCSQLGTSNQPTPQKRCRAVALRADWLETCIWDDCRAFIQNPGEALAEAQRQLEARLALRGQGEGERQRLQRALSEQMAAREGILTLLRRGKVTLEEAEAQLEAIAKDSEALRTQLSALRAQQDLAEALKAQYTAATTLLGRLQERLEEIERTNDVQAKRELVELLVVRIDVDTIDTGRRAKQADLDITYTFVPKRAVSFSTSHHTDRP